MDCYQNHEVTCFVEGRFFGYDFENESFPGREDMESLNATATFFEYVYSYALQRGYEGDNTDIGGLATFASEECKAAEVDISRQTLLNWLSKGLPANTAGGRENVYRLCFALHLNAQQTKEFFLKAYLERPFNYKDIHEAVYFFCLNNRWTYSDARRIISAVESSPLKEDPYVYIATESVGEKLCEIETEDELVRYLSENRSAFMLQNQSATKEIGVLRDRCMEIAPKEYAISTLYDKEITVKNTDELLSVIYGYSARATENGKPIFKQSISKSNFPELIKRNWPDRERFAQILEKKTASYDVIRRALIMLNFYDFFANAIVEQKEAEESRRKTGETQQDVLRVEDGLYDEFVHEMNGILAKCGYVQMYWRNPFDWMIGYCAMAPNPLRMLRDLIIEYYLNDPNVIEQ